jgi:hypothetical protein
MSAGGSSSAGKEEGVGVGVREVNQQVQAMMASTRRNMQ